MPIGPSTGYSYGPNPGNKAGTWAFLGPIYGLISEWWSYEEAAAVEKIQSFIMVF